MATSKQLLKFFFIAAFGFFSVRILVYVITGPVLHRAKVLRGSLGGSWTEVTEPTFAPFTSSSPRKVVVLTYQRCGSSFFGQLFNKNPQVFYTYEPLDALYTSLYGVREGWNVPSDITTFWNGTQRHIPRGEVAAVGRFLNSLLSCDVDSLPTESLIHRFWFLFATFHESLRDYTKCLQQHRLKYTHCADYTPGVCGGRFGQKDEERMEQCRIMLTSKPSNDVSGQDEVSKNITKYRQCMDDMRGKVSQYCSHLFKKNCEKADLRTAKTVRATMASMDLVLEKDSNTRLIHLIRDPRAVVLSRRNFDTSGRSHYAGSNLVRESEIYCRDVVRDVLHRQELEARFPGRIMTIIYDDLTKEPVRYAHQIYEFLNTTIHEKTLTWLVQNTSEKKNSTKIASKWQEKLNYKTVNQIMSKCVRFFELVNYNFS